MIRLLTLTIAICFGLCAQAWPAAAEPGADGLWAQVGSDGQVGGWFLIVDRNGVYEGTIVRMFLHPGEDPNPTCAKCTGEDKNKPSLGLTIIKGMTRKGFDYQGGTILDPRDGSVYKALMQVSPDGQKLTVRGYLGISLLGRSQTWNRLPDSAASQVDPALLARLRAPQAPRAMAIVPKPKTNGAPAQ